MVDKTPSTYKPSLKEFREAQSRLKGVTVRTPLLPLRRYRETDTSIWLKPENLQPIGSYKLRGIYNWVAKLSPEDRKKGVSTLSTGNMAQAVGYVANLFRIPARVGILDDAPQSKIKATKKYGAEIDLVPFEQAFEYIDDPPHDHIMISPVGEYGLMDGYGTIGLEIIEDALDVDTIYVPVGAGFLSSGVALASKALKPHVRVVGVQTENSPHYYVSIVEGKPTPFEFVPTLADGIAMGGGCISQEQYDLVNGSLDDVVIVSEEDISNAIRYLALENKLVVEGAGATTLAAAQSVDKAERGKCVCILSGGSIDSDKLIKILK